MARRPPITANVYFRPGTTDDEVARWREAVFAGPPPPPGVGIPSPHVQSYSGGRSGATFTFFKGDKPECA